MKRGPSEMFKVLGVDTRIKIIELLKSEGPLGAKRIAELLGVTPAAASQHLRVLRNAGFVKSERHGYRIPHWIDAEAMECCCDMLSEVCRCGCGGPGVSEVRRGAGSDLESLRRYQRKLEKELEEVKARISELRRRSS